MLSRFVLITVCWLSAIHPGFSDAIISYDDHTGVPDAGTYMPGESFTFDITLTITNTGTQPMEGIAGFNLWFATAAASTGLFRITANDFPASSPFTEHDAILPMGGELIRATGNVSSLGGKKPTPDGWASPPNSPTNTSFWVTTIAIQLDSSVQPGNYSIFSTVSSAKFSNAYEGVFTPTGPGGPFVGLPATPYFITIVPEPATWLLFAFGGWLILMKVKPKRRWSLNCLVRPNLP